jgi:hypothetical protein
MLLRLLMLAVTGLVLCLCPLLVVRASVVKAVVNRTKRQIPSDASGRVRNVFGRALDVSNFVAELGESLRSFPKNIVVCDPAPNKNASAALLGCLYNGDWYRERTITESLGRDVELSRLHASLVREVKVRRQSVGEILPIYPSFCIFSGSYSGVLVGERKSQLGSFVIDDSFLLQTYYQRKIRRLSERWSKLLL